MADVDYALRNQVSAVHNMVLQLDQSVSVVGQQVAVVGAQQEQTRNELTELRIEFQRWVQEARYTANVQQAETRVVGLRDQVEHQFGHHKEVRRSAVGLLQAFDSGLVTEDSAQAVSERLMIQTPRYWLAPVLVALARWATDDEEVCRRAVKEAFRRDTGRTSLFMALVLRRQERRDSSVRWLRHYLAAQDPRALGTDFAVILESVSHGAFGPPGLAMTGEYLDKWRELLAYDESVNTAQVVRWRFEIDSLIAPSAVNRYPRLAAVSPQWTLMNYVLSHASAHQPLLDKYTAMMAEEIVPMARVEDQIDDILDRLVQEDHEEELPLRRELKLNESIIKFGGDTEQAQRAVDADHAAFESTKDYLTIQTMSALTPDLIGVSRSTQRIAVASCRLWFGQAHDEFTRDYQMKLPQQVEATFAGDHNAGGQLFKLPPWTGSFSDPMPQLEESLAQHWDRAAEPFLATLKPKWEKSAWLAGLGVLAGMIVLGLCGGIAAALIVGLIGGGIAAGVIYSRYQTAKRNEAAARDLLARAKQDSLAQLRAAGAELTDWISEFRTASGVESRVRTMISDLETATNTGTPFEKRVVA